MNEEKPTTGKSLDFNIYDQEHGPLEPRHPASDVPMPDMTFHGHSVGQRLTVVETASFTNENGVPTSSSARFSRIVRSNEQPYFRTTSLDNEWESINLGWLSECSYLILKNAYRLKNKLDQDEYESHTMEIGILIERKKQEGDMYQRSTETTVVLSLILVRPGESVRFEPTEVENLMLRSRTPGTRFELTAFPR